MNKWQRHKKRCLALLIKLKKEVDEFCNAIKTSELSDETKEFTLACIELSTWIPIALENDKITINNLKTVIFGKGYGPKNNNKKSVTTKGNESENNNDSDSSDENDPDEKPQQGDMTANEETEPPQSDTSDGNNDNKKKKKKGHGRMSADVYNNATNITFKLEVQAGSLCMEDGCTGKLRNYRPGAFIRIVGQNIAAVTKYTVEKTAV